MTFIDIHVTTCQWSSVPPWQLLTALVRTTMRRTDVRAAFYSWASWGWLFFFLATKHNPAFSFYGKHGVKSSSWYCFPPTLLAFHRVSREPLVTLTSSAPARYSRPHHCTRSTSLRRALTWWQVVGALDSSQCDVACECLSRMFSSFHLLFLPVISAESLVEGGEGVQQRRQRREKTKFRKIPLRLPRQKHFFFL